MTWQTYRLGGTVSKAIEPLKLWETEKGIVHIDKNTLAVPVMQNGYLEGYILHGHGKLTLDMIVDTEQGAIGRSIEKQIDQPFLMLGNTENTQHHLDPATQDDLAEMGYTKQEEFLAKAQHLLNRFSNGRTQSSRCCGEGSVFAFQNEAEKLDILVAKGAKLVYKTPGTIFVSNSDKAVLKSPMEFVCISNGKSIILKT